MKAVRYFLIFIAAALAAVLIADMTFLGTATAFIRDGRMAYGLKAGSVSIGGPRDSAHSQDGAERRGADPVPAGRESCVLLLR